MKGSHRLDQPPGQGAADTKEIPMSTVLPSPYPLLITVAGPVPALHM